MPARADRTEGGNSARPTPRACRKSANKRWPVSIVCFSCSPMRHSTCARGCPAHRAAHPGDSTVRVGNRFGHTGQIQIGRGTQPGHHTAAHEAQRGQGRRHHRPDVLQHAFVPRAVPQASLLGAEQRLGLRRALAGKHRTQPHHGIGQTQLLAHLRRGHDLGRDLGPRRGHMPVVVVELDVVQLAALPTPLHVQPPHLHPGVVHEVAPHQAVPVGQPSGR
jgi:hypothetical protein